MNVSESASAGVPSSATIISTVNVPGPSASVVVQLKSPPGVIAAPAGAPTPRLNASKFAGVSASVAVAVNDSVDNSSTV